MNDRQLIADLLSALEYHTEQTRPIEFSRVAIEAAREYLRKPSQEPVAWLVCSVNGDGSLSLEHAAAWEEAAHEHINDAITEHSIEDAATWVVRPAYTSPPAQRKPFVGLTDAERETLRSEADEADAGYRELIKATEAKLRKKNS